MTLFASADLLSDFDFFANRTDNDASLVDAQKYRLLTLAQQDVTQSIAAVFPRLMMGAPVLMTTTDGGYTYTLPTTDEDGAAETPFGHAEVYLQSTGGIELFGSSYGGGWGDFVFEGNTLRVPRGQSRTITGGPYMRYVEMPGTLNELNQPTLKPPMARPLIVYRALILWANRGGLRDPRPFQELYQSKWAGSGMPGDVGILGLLHTQYAQQYAGALEGSRWWRAWLANGGSGSLSGMVSD
jgi:hypothetical protein